MIGVVVGFVSSVLYGASDFVAGIASRRSTVLRTAVWTNAGALAVASLALIGFAGAWSAPLLVAGGAAGLCTVLAFLALYAALAAAPMGVVTAIVAATQAFAPVLVSVLWKGHPLGLLGWLGAGVAVAGACLIGLAERGTVGGAGWRPLALAAASGVGFGGAIVALDAAPVDSGLTAPAIELGVALLVLLAFAAGAARSRPLRRFALSTGLTISGVAGSATTALLAALGGAMMGLGNLALMVALRIAPLAVVGVVTSLYPVTTALLARVLIGERLSRRHVAGIAAAILGCCLLAIA